MKPKISVLIPVYNAGKYLPRCLQALQDQTFKDFEIICIDDGSTDNSLQYLQTLANQKQHLRVFTQKNAGVAVTRNRLLDAAQGKYISFVDADDWIEQTYLEKLYQAAEQTGADITKCFYKQFNAQTAKWESAGSSHKFYQPVGKSIGARVQAGHYDSIVWGKLYRRAWLKKENIRFFAACAAAEDLGFNTLSFVLANEITIVKEQLYVYCKGIANSITSNSEKMDIGVLKNHIWVLDELFSRRKYDRAAVDFLLRTLIADTCRLRKLPKEQQVKYQELMESALKILRKTKQYGSGCGKMRVNLFLFLAGKPLTKRFYFWGKVFR